MLSTHARTVPYALKAHVVATALSEGALLLDLESKFFYRLNPSGWAILQMFENGGTTLQTAREHCEAWGCPVNDAALERFLEGLVNNGLVGPSTQTVTVEVTPPSPWAPPEIERQSAPLQRLMMSAFDPTMPLAE